MRISIKHDSKYLIEFDQVQVNGRKALGGYALTFTLKGMASLIDPPVMIYDLHLILSTANQKSLIASSIRSSSQIIQIGAYSGSEQVSFEAMFTKEQINALEEYRQEKELQLNFGLRATTSSGSEPRVSLDNIDVIISREHWLNALKDSGFRKTILYEVPLPDVDEEMNGFIVKAQTFIETGHYKEAVIQCRHIIEAIEGIRDDRKLSIAANTKAHGSERKDMTAIERMLSLREQIKNVCQLGAHGSEIFTRSQAKAVLGITLSLLAEPTVGFARIESASGVHPS